MTERFLKFIKIILNNECGKGNGYVNDKDDAGGITIYGITRKNHPYIAIWDSITSLLTVKERKAYKPTNEEMNEIYAIYYKDYYKKLQCDYFQCENLALQVFDFGVNAGVSRAAKALQNILHITEDGIVGQQTIATSNNNTCKYITEAYKQKRKDYYNTISKKGNNSKFLKGWLKRVDNTIC